jgi:hypothetical protein
MTEPDPLAALRQAALDLPDPIDALAAVAYLAATYPTSAAAREAARMLRNYAVAHSARIAANKRGEVAA